VNLYCSVITFQISHMPCWSVLPQESKLSDIHHQFTPKLATVLAPKFHPIHNLNAISLNHYSGYFTTLAHAV
jgi:hypothetical protein